MRRAAGHLMHRAISHCWLNWTHLALVRRRALRLLRRAAVFLSKHSLAAGFEAWKQPVLEKLDSSSLFLASERDDEGGGWAPLAEPSVSVGGAVAAMASPLTLTLTLTSTLTLTQGGAGALASPAAMASPHYRLVTPTRESSFEIEAQKEALLQAERHRIAEVSLKSDLT